MYSLVYHLYFVLKRHEKRIKEQGKSISRPTQRALDYIEWFYNVPVRRWYEKHPSKRYGLNKQERPQKIIVSLTSYPKRIHTVWLTIETLLRQSVKPDKVILWLADTQFNGLESLPQELLRLRERGLTIRFCEDLRSHKKYFYTMQEYPEDLVILVDDDMLYPRDTILRLLQMHQKYPTDICTMTAQKITPSIQASPSLWKNPMLSERFEHSSCIQIFTGSGSIYPPHSLCPAALESALIFQLCPNADDLWLTFMALLEGTKITAQFPWRAFPVTIYGTNQDSLWYINAEQGQNDIQWQAIMDYFNDEALMEKRIP